MPIVVHSGLLRGIALKVAPFGLKNCTACPKERLSGIALAKPEKRRSGPKDAVYGWALDKI